MVLITRPSWIHQRERLRGNSQAQPERRAGHVLTGDNGRRRSRSRKKVGIHVDELLLGSDAENLNDE